MTEPILSQHYTQFGGKHAETASLTNILAAQGICAPHSGKPLTEAMLLGIGGGLGAGYILWELKEHDTKVLAIGWQNRWQYTMQFYEHLCSRLSLKPTFHETGSQKAAAQQLDEVLAAGQAVVAWIDRAQMPYLQLHKSQIGHFGHFVSIYGLEAGDVLVDDLAAKPFRVPVEIMASARGRIGSYKNRLLSVTSTGEIDLPAAILAGIQDEIEHLNQDSDSFSLLTFQKWGKMMTHRKNSKGWPVVFADRHGLYGALKSVYDGVELVSTGGGGMRGLYADFLDEAASIINRPALRDVAMQYRSLASQWSAFASETLPESNEALGETRHLLRQRYELLMNQSGNASEAMQGLTGQLNQLHTEYDKNFPMTDIEIDTLFSTMGDQLLALYDAERAALNTLSEAMK